MTYVWKSCPKGHLNLLIMINHTEDQPFPKSLKGFCRICADLEVVKYQQTDVIPAQFY